MKLNFKTLLIIFLVALLGAGLGTFGVINIYQNDKKQIKQETTNNPIQISQVTYDSKKETDYTQAIDKAYNSVVEISCTIKSTYSSNYFFFDNGSSYSTSAGSGVIISDDGYIVTNNHVVEGISSDEDIEVKLYTGETYNAKLIGSDSRTDIAVLKIDETNLPYSIFADSSKLVLGEDVIAIGNPLGTGIACSNGIISAPEKEIYINKVYLTVIQTNAAVNAGNSGGGLFDLNGNIVGIVNAKKSANYSETSIEGMGYAIPSNTVIKIVDELIENGYVKDRASLGIKVYTGSSYYYANGVIVTDVIKGGGAEEAGIEINDIIIKVNDIDVQSYADLSKILDTKIVGDVVTVTVQRNNEEKSFKVTLQQSVAN